MKRRLTIVASALLLSSAVSGCYVNRYYTESPTRPMTEPDYADRLNNHFLFGLIHQRSEHVDLSQVCPGGVAFAQNKVSFVNGLLSAITFNIYTPTETLVWCQD